MPFQRLTTLISLTPSISVSATVDESNDKLYVFLNSVTVGQYIVIDLSTFTANSFKTLAATYTRLRGTSFDETYMYYGTGREDGSNPYLLRSRRDTSNFDAALNLAIVTEGVHTTAVLDGFIYAGSNQGHVVKVSTSSFTKISTVTVTGASDTLKLRNAVFDNSIPPNNTFLYMGTNGGRVHKTSISPSFGYIGFIDMGGSSKTDGMAFVDGLGFLYIGGTNTTSKPCLFKIDLSTFTLSATLVFDTVNNGFTWGGAIDSANAIAYVAYKITGGANKWKFAKIDLLTFTLVDTLTGAGDSDDENVLDLHCVAINSSKANAYLVTSKTTIVDVDSVFIKFDISIPFYSPIFNRKTAPYLLPSNSY